METSWTRRSQEKRNGMDVGGGGDDRGRPEARRTSGAWVTQLLLVLECWISHCSVMSVSRKRQAKDRVTHGRAGGQTDISLPVSTWSKNSKSKWTSYVLEIMYMHVISEQSNSWGRMATRAPPSDKPVRKGRMKTNNTQVTSTLHQCFWLCIQDTLNSAAYMLTLRGFYMTLELLTRFYEGYICRETQHISTAFRAFLTWGCRRFQGSFLHNSLAVVFALPLKAYPSNTCTQVTPDSTLLVLYLSLLEITLHLPNEYMYYEYKYSLLHCT